MLPDESVFGKTSRWKPKYQKIWREWLARDDRKMHVLFHDE
jgi:hypothetical protein